MKIKLLLLVAALFVSVQSMAQYGYGYGGYGRGYGSGLAQTPNPAPKPLTSDKMADEQTKWMKKKLKLDEEQAISVETVNLDYCLRLIDYQEAFTKSHANIRPTQQELQDIRKLVDTWWTEREAKYQKILTPEQWELYLQKKKTMPYANNSTN